MLSEPPVPADDELPAAAVPAVPWGRTASSGKTEQLNAVARARYPRRDAVWKRADTSINVAPISACAAD
jgi:hypothetical protein